MTYTPTTWVDEVLSGAVNYKISSNPATVTITIATPAVISWPGHGLSVGDIVVFATTGTLPTGLTAGTYYYVIAAGLTANAFEVSASLNGAAVNTSGSQSGTQTAQWVQDQAQILLQTNVATAGTPVNAAGLNNMETELSALDVYLRGLPEGTMVNGKIVPSVASNNLTLALKNSAGSDPSASSPVLAMVGGSLRVISAALSVTKNAGTNWCNAGGAELATKEVDYFARLGYNATDGVTIAFSRDPTGLTYADFDTTATGEKYCAISVITHAAAADPYPVVGRFAATLSAGAGYTWTVPTYTEDNLIQCPIFETRWLSWHPVGTNLTDGSASITALYKTVRGGYKYQWNWRYGAGSAVGTNVNITMPWKCALTSASGSTPGGVGAFFISGVASYLGQPLMVPASNVLYPITLNVAATYPTQTLLTASIPGTWAANCEMQMLGEVPI